MSAAGRVLVVDDEAGFRDLMTFELGSRGHEVVVACNGDEALAKVRAGGLDVVVSDLTMPKRGGLDVLAGVKETAPDVEVIMVTGYATRENAVESMRRGAYDFITKPLQIEDLARLVERALEKRRLSRKVVELEEINRFKSEFLANMSHELRTPMNAILGYTALHLDRLYGEVNPKQEDALRRVEGAGKNLLTLINSVLDLSKVAAGRMPVYLEEFDLKKLRALDAPASPGRAARGAGTPHVLVVDDDRAVVEFLSETLSREGYLVESVAGGADALERLARIRPDLLFLDLMMPGVTGFDVLEAVGKEEHLKDMTVIVLTAKSLSPQESEYLQERAGDVIQKGSKSLSEILAIVRRRLLALEAGR